MKEQRQKLIVIVGPTASGKSDLAVKLAKKFNSEVISADSRQIYRGLDIGTGKVPGKWKLYRSPTSYGSRTSQEFVYKNVPHHCIDFVSPRQVFTAAEFVHEARRAIDTIVRRGRIPMIAGGTAFWIDALVYNFSLPEVAPNARLRRALEKKSPPALFSLLKKLDPRRAAEIEQKNPRRLIRAIEIARALGRVPRLVKHSMFDTLWIGLNPPFSILARRVMRRADAMIQQGLVAETKKLVRHRVSEKRIREFGFEYRAALLYNHGALTKKEFTARLTRDTIRYAKQQMRWWKRNPEIRWLGKPDNAAPLVRKFLQKTPSRPAKR